MVGEKKATPHGMKGKHVASTLKTASKTKQDYSSATVVTLDQRKNHDRRTGDDRRVRHVPVAVERRTLERRAKVNRRRQIDPTTCERDYTADEIEFMNAMDE